MSDEFSRRRKISCPNAGNILLCFVRKVDKEIDCAGWALKGRRRREKAKNDGTSIILNFVIDEPCSCHVEKRFLLVSFGLEVGVKLNTKRNKRRERMSED